MRATTPPARTGPSGGRTLRSNHLRTPRVLDAVLQTIGVLGSKTVDSGISRLLVAIAPDEPSPPRSRHPLLHPMMMTRSRRADV